MKKMKLEVMILGVAIVQKDPSIEDVLYMIGG